MTKVQKFFSLIKHPSFWPLAICFTRSCIGYKTMMRLKRARSDKTIAKLNEIWGKVVKKGG